MGLKNVIHLIVSNVTDKMNADVVDLETQGIDCSLVMTPHYYSKIYK